MSEGSCKSRAPTMPSDDEFDCAARGGESPAECREQHRRRSEMRRLAVTGSVPSGASNCGEGNEICAEGGSEELMEEEEVVAAAPVFGAISVSGRSREMEDAVCAKTGMCRPGICGGQPVHFFGVYDGHGGAHVAALCRDKMHILLEEELARLVVISAVGSGVGGSSASEEALKLPASEEEGWWRVAVARCFQRMDEVAMNTCRCGSFGFQCGCRPMESSLTGSTAVVAVVTADHILVANCGDSRAVLCRGGRAVPLSFDHKPDRSDERARIEASDGRVIYLNGARVEGILAMSRALGDKYLKPIVISDPEITFTRRHPEDECLILASDGLWDVMSNELVCEVASECLRDGTPTEVGLRARGDEGQAAASGEGMFSSRSASAAALLTRLALGRRSNDNISVIVIDLKGSS